MIAERIAALLLLLGLAGCASSPALTTSTIIDPKALAGNVIPAKILMPIKTIEVYDATQNKRIDKDVLSLTGEQIRQRLTTTETLVAIMKRDANGSLSYVGSSGKVSRGSYQVTFDYANYTNQEVSDTAGTSTAIGMIGVGLRITADLETSSNDVDISGLLPIGFGFKSGNVKGRLSFKVFGISNDKVALAVPTTSILDEGSIQKSFEAAATVRTFFSLPDTKLEPYLIGVSNVTPIKAPQALEAAAAKLTK